MQIQNCFSMQIFFLFILIIRRASSQMYQNFMDLTEITWKFDHLISLRNAMGDMRVDLKHKLNQGNVPCKKAEI